MCWQTIKDARHLSKRYGTCKGEGLVCNANYRLKINPHARLSKIKLTSADLSITGSVKADNQNVFKRP